MHIYGNSTCNYSNEIENSPVSDPLIDQAFVTTAKVMISSTGFSYTVLEKVSVSLTFAQAWKRALLHLFDPAELFKGLG